MSHYILSLFKPGFHQCPKGGSARKYQKEIKSLRMNKFRREKKNMTCFKFNKRLHICIYTIHNLKRCPFHHGIPSPIINKILPTKNNNNIIYTMDRRNYC